MRDRRYGVDSRGRSSSPRRHPLLTSRDFFSPSRHHKLPQYRLHETEEYSREANTKWRIEERVYLDRDSNLCASIFSEYDNRNKDRYVGRGCGSPRRIENKDNFDRPVSYPNYEDGVEGKYENEISFDRSKRSYGEGSYPGDLSSRKCQYDPLSDGPKFFDYSSTRDSHEMGDTDITRGGEKDYYSQNCYSVSDRAQLLSAPWDSDGAKPAPTEYESGRRMYSRPYTLTDGGVDEKSFGISGGDGGSHMSSVASRYLNIDTDKQRFFDVRNDLCLERRDGLHDQEDHYVEKKTDNFHFQDRFLGTRKALEREIPETYKFKDEDNLLSSRSYNLKGDSDHMVSSSRSKDYDTMPMGILKEGFPGYTHISSYFIRGGCGLPSQPVSFDGYSEKKQTVFPGEPGGQLDGTRSSSGLFIRLPEERKVDRSYEESDRIVIDSMQRFNEVEGDYKDQHPLRTGLLNRSVDERFNKSHMGDDGLWGQDPSFQAQFRNVKFDPCGPLHLGTESSRPKYISEGSFRCGGVKPKEHLVDVDGRQWSYSERSDLSQGRGYDPSFDELYGSPRNRSHMADLSMVGHSERRLREERVSDEILYEHDVGIRISTDENGARRIYKQVDEEDDDLLYSSKKPKLRRSDYEKTWRVSGEMSNDQPSSSKFHPHRSLGPHKSDSRDIKKRLGPVCQKLHVSQRLVDTRKPSVKQRLTPAPARLKKHPPPPWLKKRVLT